MSDQPHQGKTENKPPVDDEQSPSLDMKSQSVDMKSPRQTLRPEKPPKAPNRSRYARNGWVVVFNFFFSVAILSLLAAGAALYWGGREYVAAGPLEQSTRVIIPKGTGLRDIGDNLSRNNVIKSPFLFWASVSLQKKASQLKAGEYFFEKGTSMRDVVAKLIEGKAVIYKVTLPEGLTSQQIVKVLREDKILTGDIEEVPAEGSLLPETYTFGRGTTRQQIIDLMKEKQNKAIKRIWANRVDGLPFETVEEMVILASIVEKETGKSNERSRVAAVFINRLKKGIKLQSDPTIIYGLFGGAGKPKGRPIYRSDIKKPTPYNTYTIPALPLGPISNPGMASLEAVANPSVTDEFYFVADGTGGHVFSKTLEEHNANVRKWRLIEKERKAKKAEEEQAAEPN